MRIADEDVIHRYSCLLGNALAPGIMVAETDDVRFDERDPGGAALVHQRAQIELLAGLDPFGRGFSHIIPAHVDRLARRDVRSGITRPKRRLRMTGNREPGQA